MRFSFAVSAVLVALTSFFAIQNAQHTRVSFFAWYLEAPLAILLLGTFAAGAAAAWLLLLPGSIRKRLEISRLKGRVTVPPAPSAEPPPPPSVGKGEEGRPKP